MEGLQCLQLLAHADELDRHARDRLDGERRATAGIAIELRHHDAVEAEAVVEAPSDIDRLLAGHRIDHQQDLVRMHRTLDVA